MLSLSQRQSLLQRLSPQQVQYLKMLQLPVLALEQRIKEELEVNPLLEELNDGPLDELGNDTPEYDADPAPSMLESQAQSQDTDGSAADSDRLADTSEASKDDREIDWDEYMAGEYEGYKAPTFTGQEHEEQDEYPQRAEETLSEQLLAQLRMHNLTDDEIALAEEIIGNIDDHGYLVRDLAEIVDDLNKFIAATRTAPASSRPRNVLGDGQFDAYESVVTDEPFGRERWLAHHGAELDGDDEAFGGDPFHGESRGSRHDALDDDLYGDPGHDGYDDGFDNGDGLDASEALEHAPYPAVRESAPPEPAAHAEQPTMATMSLEQMSRLSIEELSRLLEQGTSAFAAPADTAVDGNPATNGFAAGTPVAGTAAAGATAVGTEIPATPPTTTDGAGNAAPVVEEIFSLQEAERILRLLQRLDPPGIGARDLRECLMVQLEPRLEQSPAHELAYRMLRDTYADFTMKHFEKIIQRLGCTTEQLKDAIEVVRTLNPKPGGGASAMAGTNYVTPDFVVEYDENEFVITSNDRNLPALRINRAYQELMRRGEGRRKDADRDARKFVREKFEAAKWFIASIHQRRQTMLKVMRAIVDLQSDFFAGGPNHLRPMIYKDVAERIEMDISTVCRVVNGKYVQTDYGTFELRYFFSEKLETVTGEEVSTKVVRSRIQEMIEAEDKRKPLSDDAIALEMEKAGFQVARRTVAKYREQLNIPVARLRRSL